MILTKNKLKNKKVKLDDDDENHYMNFLRFKHLMDRRDRTRNRTNRGTQTEIETNNDKATDTLNDFDEVLEPFRLKTRSQNFENNEKATQTNAMRDQETDPRYDVNFKDYILKGSENAFSSRWKGQRLKDRRDMMTQVYIASLRGEQPSPPDTDDDEYKPGMALQALGLGVSAGAVGLYATYQGLRLGVNVTQNAIRRCVSIT